MKIIEYIRLGECAICPYSFKKKDQSLMCGWDEDTKKVTRCEKIKKCGNFPKGKIDVSNLEIE